LGGSVCNLDTVFYFVVAVNFVVILCEEDVSLILFVFVFLHDCSDVCLNVEELCVCFCEWEVLLAYSVEECSYLTRKRRHSATCWGVEVVAVRPCRVCQWVYVPKAARRPGGLLY
jgi:hypothetical protein